MSKGSNSLNIKAITDLKMFDLIRLNLNSIRNFNKIG